MNYQEYLKTPTWQTLRKSALKRANNRCQLCNSKDLLHVHHRKYPKKFGLEPVSDLTVLCEKCHVNFHKSNESIPLLDTTSQRHARQLDSLTKPMSYSWGRNLRQMIRQESKCRVDHFGDIFHPKP